MLLHWFWSFKCLWLTDAVVHRGQGSTLSSPISDPRAELRLSLPSNSLSEGRRGGGVLRTYGDNSCTKIRLEMEPAAAISRTGSLTNGSPIPKVQNIESGAKETAVPSRKSLEDLGRMVFPHILRGYTSCFDSLFFDLSEVIFWKAVAVLQITIMLCVRSFWCTFCTHILKEDGYFVTNCIKIGVRHSCSCLSVMVAGREYWLLRN